MGAGRQLTPDEAALLEQYLLQQQGMVNPLAYSANEWGQGPGILGMEDRPDSFSRVNDVNDRLRDLTSTIDVDFNEMVPGLHPFVAPPKPGDVAPYQSDTSFLYSNNPVYQAIGQMVSGVDGEPPMSLDQALLKFQSEYEENPEEFAGMVPVATADNLNAGIRAGDLDLSQIRQGAETFLTETRKEQNSMSEAEALQQQYEDFVRPRSQYEYSGSPTYQDVRGEYAEKFGWDDPKLQYEELNPGARPAPAARVPMNLENVQGGGRVLPGMQLSDLPGGYSSNAPDIQLTPDRITSLTRNPLAGARRQQRGDQARADAEAVRNSPNRPMVGGIRGRGENQYMGSSTVKRNDREELFKAGFDKALEAAKKRQVASKKEENIAKLIAAYNSYHYGQA